MRTVSDLGEKELIRTFIKPYLNPAADPNLVGDDCAVIPVGESRAICISTDRVPADLISFRLGLIDYEGLGYYLAVLNLSDIAAMGAEPSGILLNFGLEKSFTLESFRQLIEGAKRACDKYGCVILGGDLSSAEEMSISATSVGIAPYPGLLRRSGALPGDSIYCSSSIGLTPTAFSYFLEAKPQGLILETAEEEILAGQFRSPQALFSVGAALRGTQSRITAMDNTDGIGQSLAELAEINNVNCIVDAGLLPIHSISYKVAAYLGIDVIDLVLGPGADFQLVGTIEPGLSLSASALDSVGVRLIGQVVQGSGVSLRRGDSVQSFKPRGWNYFAPKAERRHDS